MRHLPKAGAVCGNSARTDLCGGQGVTSVPTATVFWSPTYPLLTHSLTRSGNHAVGNEITRHTQVQ